MELWDMKRADILYGKDVDERIEELQDALDADYPEDPEPAWERGDAQDELDILTAFRDEASGCDDYDG